MNKLTCIVVDDDLRSIEQICGYIKSISGLKLINYYSNPLIALAEIKQLKEPVDFLFTDIEMNELNGLDLAQQTRDKVKCLIIVSGHIKYSANGYDVNARQFLHKPFDFNRFRKVINDLSARLFPKKNFITIKLSREFHPLKILLDEIIMIEGASDYVKIHTLKKSFLPYLKLNFIEDELKEHSNFQRINRSFIINTNFIEKIEGFNIHLKGHLLASVGRSYQKDFRKKMLNSKNYLFFT